MSSRQYIISGKVQGVGYCTAVWRLAIGTGVVGWVKKLPDGTVEVIAKAPDKKLEGFGDALQTTSEMAVVENVAISSTKEKIGFYFDIH